MFENLLPPTFQTPQHPSQESQPEATIPSADSSGASSESDAFHAAAAEAVADLPIAGGPAADPGTNDAGAQAVEHEGQIFIITPDSLKRWMNYIPEQIARLTKDDSFLLSDFERELMAPYTARVLGRLLAATDDPERAAFILGFGFYMVRLSPAMMRMYVAWKKRGEPRGADHVVQDRSTGQGPTVINAPRIQFDTPAPAGSAPQTGTASVEHGAGNF